MLEIRSVDAAIAALDVGVTTSAKASGMAQLTPRFSTNRTVREYTERYYLPAAAAYRERAARRGELGARIAQWRRALDEHWPALRFGRVNVETHDGEHRFEVEVHLGELGPDDVQAHETVQREEEHRGRSARHPQEPDERHDEEQPRPLEEHPGEQALRPGGPRYNPGFLRVHRG